MKKQRRLIEKFLNQNISLPEREILKNWVLEDENNMMEFKKKIKEFGSENFVQFESEKAFENFISETQPKKTKVISFKPYLKYASIFVGMIVLGSLYNNSIRNEITDYATSINKGFNTDTNVKITLSDGTVKILNNDQEKNITDKNGNLVAKKGDSILSFNINNSIAIADAKLNEVYIPHGQKLRIELEDGTIVWLNSGSTLKFPESFNSSNSSRNVSLVGEAYFDVTKNEKKPFIVNAGAIDIKVLGTRFNVSSYKNDNTINTTLVEGLVNVYSKNNPENSLKLIPSFQATFNKDYESLSNTKVETEIYTAWMQNKIIINDLKFSEILKRLERTHNVVFVNNAKEINNEVYKGEFEDENIETILETISATTPFKFTVKGDVITISTR